MEKHNTAFSNKSSQCVFFIGVKVLPKTQSLSLTGLPFLPGPSTCLEALCILSP